MQIFGHIGYFSTVTVTVNLSLVSGEISGSATNKCNYKIYEPLEGVFGKWKYSLYTNWFNVSMVTRVLSHKSSLASQGLGTRTSEIRTRYLPALTAAQQRLVSNGL